MQQLIVLATPDGVVDMTPQAIAARTSIPLDLIIKGLKVLSEPDPYTRTPGEEGRRIVLMDDHRPWGWRLVNHGKYRALRDQEQKRESDRRRIAEKRNKNSDVATTSQSVANVAHTYSHTDSDSLKPEGDKSPEKQKPVDRWWLTHRGIDLKGKEVGVPPLPGESYPNYKSRIFDYLNKPVIA